MSSPFKLFGRALGSLRGGPRQKAPSLSAGVPRQPIVAHPQTGQLILQEQTIQPEEGMYSVFSLDGVEILVRYSKILAYTLPQGPLWKDTGMVYVSPKLEALNLHKGASFTVFVGRIHYLVTVIEELSQTLPISASVEDSRLPQERKSNIDDMSIFRHPPAPDSKRVGLESALKYQLHSQHDEPDQFLTPDAAALGLVTPSPTKNAELPPITMTISRSTSISDDPFGPIAPKDDVFTSADRTSAIGDSNILSPTLPNPHSPPKCNTPEPGRSTGRYPLTPISNSKVRSTKATKRPPPIDSEETLNLQDTSPIITARAESRKSPPPPPLKLRPIRRHLCRSPTAISGPDGENRPEPVAAPQASQISTPTIVHTYTSLLNGPRPIKQGRSTAPELQRKQQHADPYPKSPNDCSINCEPATSRRSSTENGFYKESPSAMHANKGRRGAPSEKKALPDLPPPQGSPFSFRNTNLERELEETLLLTPKAEQPQSLTEEHYLASGHSYSSSRDHDQHAQFRPVPPQPRARPTPRRRSSSLPPLRSSADEIFVPDAVPRNMPPIGAGRKNLVEKPDIRSTKLAPVSAAGPPKASKGKGRAMEPSRPSVITSHWQCSPPSTAGLHTEGYEPRDGHIAGEHVAMILSGDTWAHWE